MPPIPAAATAQRRLAAELTRLVHGDEGLRTAERATEIFFGAEIGELSRRPTGRHLRRRAQQANCPASGSTATGLPIIDALVEAGLAKNKGEARRTITQGGAYVNNRRVEGIDARLGPADLAGGAVIVLRSGKKNYALLRFE